MKDDFDPMGSRRDAFDFATGMSKVLHGIEAAEQSKLLAEQVRLQKEALELGKKKLALEEEKARREQLERESARQPSPPSPAQRPSTSINQQPIKQPVSQFRIEILGLKAAIQRSEPKPDATRIQEMMSEFEAIHGQIDVANRLDILGLFNQYMRELQGEVALRMKEVRREEMHKKIGRDESRFRQEEIMREFEEKYRRLAYGIE